MPLLLCDLDNTLVDRAAAFRGWAEEFATRTGGGDDAVRWLIDTDRDGMAPLDEVFSAIRERFGLDGSVQDLVDGYLDVGVPRRVTSGPGVIDVLARLKSDSWKVGVVTNGRLLAQTLKMEVSGLMPLLDGWAISEEVGVSKPDPAIFRVAAERCGAPDLATAWMVGDDPASDIGGAHALGMRTVWMSRGRIWDEPAFRPDFTVATFPEAVELALAGEP